MPAYIVSYDKNEEDDYKDLTDALEAYDTYWHHLGSTWVVVTNQGAKEIGDYLLKHLDRGDKLLVVKSGVESYWYGFNEKGSDWLTKYL